MAKNLFEKAKKESKTKSVKKDEKIIVNVPGAEFAEKLEKFATLKAQMDELKAELAMSQEFVKNVGIEEFAKLVETNKINVGSFILVSEKGGSVMVLPTKKYITIDESAAENLKETYGEDIVDEETSYGFNTEILMKNMDIISDLIQNSDAISQEDKDALIEATTKYAINKDALDKVYNLAKKSGKSVAEVIADIQPVFQNKNAKA
ncbi:MAG: hypothetical protein HPY57_14260 [Ignavibacteria bacterium]|nr:hypothetical protein [Ignavibacteria bacterium]